MQTQTLEIDCFPFDQMQILEPMQSARIRLRLVFGRFSFNLSSIRLIWLGYFKFSLEFKKNSRQSKKHPNSELIWIYEDNNFNRMD